MPTPDMPENLDNLVRRFLSERGLINPNMWRQLGKLGWLLAFDAVDNVLNSDTPAPTTVNQLKMALKVKDGSEAYLNRVETLADKAFADLAQRLGYKAGELERHYDNMMEKAIQNQQQNQDKNNATQANEGSSTLPPPSPF